MYCEDDYLQKDLPRSHFWEIYGQGIKFPRVNSLDIPKLLKQFFKNNLWNWLLLQTKMLLKSGIRKDVAASVKKELMNKSSSKMYFSGFSFSLYYTVEHL